MARGGEIVWEAVLDPKRLVAGFNAASHASGPLGKNLKGIGSLLGGITPAAIGAGAAIGGLLAVTRSSIQTYAEFEQSIANVKAVSGATDREIERLEKRTRQLGATTQFTAKQAADGAVFLAQAGFSSKETLEALEGALNLAAAGNLSLARSADIASNVVSGFRLEASQTARVADTMAAAAASSNTNVEQLGTALSYVAPVAQAAGLSLEQTTAIIGELGNAGIQGSRAGTAVRGMLSNLLSPAGKAAKALERLGVATRDQTGAARDLFDVTRDLREAGLDVADAVAIFGKRQAAAALVTVEQTEAIEAQTKALEMAEGQAKRMAEVRLDTHIGDVQRLKSQYEALEIDLQSGNDTNRKTLGLLRDIVEGLRKELALRQKLAELDRKGYVGPGLTLELPQGQGYTKEEQAEAERDRAKAAADAAQARVDAYVKEQQALKDVRDAIQGVRKAEQARFAEGQHLARAGQERLDMARVEEQLDFQMRLNDMVTTQERIEAKINGVYEARQRVNVIERRLQEASLDTTKKRLEAELEIARAQLQGRIGADATGGVGQRVSTIDTPIGTQLNQTAQLSQHYEVLISRSRAFGDAASDAFERSGQTARFLITQVDSLEEGLKRLALTLGYDLAESGLRALFSSTASRTLNLPLPTGRSRQYGGFLPAGEAAVVGERGRERIVAAQDAYVQPGGDRAPLNITIVNNIESTGQDNEALANEVAYKVEASLTKRELDRQLTKRNG